MNRERKAEILAPAGSYESFRAAILAGADAVYAGGLVLVQGLMQRIFQKSRCLRQSTRHIFTGESSI